MFVPCEKCGKTIIERKHNGLWKFRFGKYGKDDTIIDMEIHGSVKLKCLRKSCRHVNILNYLPPS